MTDYQKKLISKYADFNFPEHKSMFEVEEYAKSLLDLVPASLTDFKVAQLYYTAQFNAFGSDRSLMRPILNRKNPNRYADYSINLVAYVVKRNSKSERYYNSNFSITSKMLLFFEKDIEYIFSTSSLLSFELMIYKSISKDEILDKGIPFFEYVSLLENSSDF